MAIKSIFGIMCRNQCDFHELKLYLSVPMNVEVKRITRVHDLRGIHLVGFYLDPLVAYSMSAQDVDELMQMVHHHLNRSN